MYCSPFCNLSLLCCLLCVVRLGVEHCTADVQDRYSNASHGTNHAEISAVDQVQNDAQDTEYRHDNTPGDKFPSFFTAFTVLNSLDARNQLADTAN